MMYNKLVEACFFTPKHVGVLDTSDSLCVHFFDRAGGRGDRVDFYISCDNQGKILMAKFKAYGNPYLIAAAEWICQKLEGDQIDHHPSLDYTQLVEVFEMPNTQYPVALRIEGAYQEVVAIMQEKLKRLSNE